MTSTADRLASLQAALLPMKGTGEDGFEGLMQDVLTEVTGIPFRLSASGLQYGRDGAAAYPEDAVCFECKLYKGRIARDSVLSKLAPSPGRPSTDLWVLCATSAVSDQLAHETRFAGEQQGLSICLLDWFGEFPPLAVALALASGRLSNWLAHETLADLELLRHDSRFEDHARRLRRELQEATVGVAAAAAANRRWLVDRFSDAGSARRVFGTRLAPFDPKFGEPYVRERSVERVRDYLDAEAPEESVLWVTGAEGTGKSWLLVQAWAGLDEKPLMVLLRPADFVADLTPEERLIRALVKQTGETDRDGAGAKWRRKFARWRRQGGRSGPAIVVVIDGLNQRSEVEWPARVDEIEEELDLLNGRLVATVRTEFFRRRIGPYLDYVPEQLRVSEWSELERDTILAQHGVNVPGYEIGERHFAVLEALRNPRLLGIAIELLGKQHVKSIDELGVSRLLLEHMLVGSRDTHDQPSFYHYANDLRKHAERILRRVARGVVDDLGVFEDMETIADGRFFVEVQHDPGRYTLADGALVLALGFCVVDRLRRADRNNRDPWPALEAVLDPIGSLDQTTKVIEAALAISAVDDGEEAVVGPLVAAFAGLQNPSRSLLPIFRKLVTAWPKAFLDTVERMLLEGGHHPNLDWIEDALCEARADPDGWSAISVAVSGWFRYYSRPVRESESEGESPGDGEVWFDPAHVSAGEESVLEGMTDVSGKVEPLSRFGLRLIAGRKLAPFAEGLVQTVFANALEQDALSVPREVAQLVRLNRLDWQETREALREARAVLEGGDTSRAGRWALVTLLRSTGDEEDGSSADRLVRQLSDWDGGETWRLVEDYCASDPCDPSALEPDNLVEAIECYDKLDVEQLHPAGGQTRLDHMFKMLRPAMARFAPARAAEKHRDFGRHVFARDGHALRLGLYALEPHNSTLGRELALELLAASRRNGPCGSAGERLEAEDRWIVSEYGRLHAFPYLSAPEQLQLLPEVDDKRGVLLRLVGLAKPLDEADLHRRLDEACEAKRAGAISALLAFCRMQRVRVSEGFRERLASLMESPEEIVRSTALGVVEYIEGTELVARFAESGWTSADSRESLYSDFFGSLIMMRAAEEQLITWAEALCRVSARTYGLAAERGGEHVSRMVAELIRRSIDSALGRHAPLPGSRQVEIGVPPRDQAEPPLARVRDQPIQADAAEWYMALTAGFARRHRQNKAFFEKFADRLRRWNAEIVMYQPSLEAFDEIVRSSEDLADRWTDQFMSASDPQVSLLRGVALSLAHALRERSPDVTAELLRRVKGVHSMVRHTHYATGVDLGAFVSWSAAGTEDLVRLCFERLDDAGNDHEIASEVLAALAADRDALLARFVDERWTTSEPEGMARALMVLGFSRPHESNRWDLEATRIDHGFLGQAWKAAKYAWDRDRWAREWYGEMCAACHRVEFWRSSVLFTKIVDARFGLWRSDFDTSSDLMRKFESSVGGEIENRLKRWRNHRRKKLFGGNVPAEVFQPRSRSRGQPVRRGEETG